MLKITRLISLYLIISFFLTLHYCEAQTKKYIAIIPPFHSRQVRSGTESSLQLKHQLFVVFVYQNAVAVYSESEFFNPTDNVLEQELALPSTGHDENGNESGGRISNGILSIQLWVQGERLDPEYVLDGNEGWFLVRTKFPPLKNRIVKALFWAETSLKDIDYLPGLDTTVIIDGKRGFLINLAHAAVWNSFIESIDIYVVLNGGISTNRDSFDIKPASYELKDSTLTWSMKYIEPSEKDNIEISYDSYGDTDSNIDTMSKLSTFIVKHVYDQLIHYARQLDE